ncbi:MAG TPA: hypothetical protein DDW81_14800 [Cryomorphaceae bacterium]|nr:hypothetical protein [Owenweeksia sp.]HBF21367.1 hypothetical protein [Cryomorphaceae bacterium]
MKKMILSCLLLVAGAVSAVAQSSTLTITNNTNCAYVVVLYNEQDDCNLSCAVKVCVPSGPGVTVPVNPCNPNWYWDRAIVYPSIDSCDPCSAPIGVAAPNPTNCLGLPNPVSSRRHCAGCGPFTVDFSSTTTLDIN